MLALVVQRVNLGRVKKFAGFLVVKQRVPVEAVPKPHDDIGEFVGAFIPVGVAVMALQIEI